MDPAAFDRPVEKIVVIKPSALGDVVQSLPLLSALKVRYPEATIDWVISSSLASLLEGHPLLRSVLHYERRGGVRAFLRLLRQLRRERYDLVIDLQGLARTGAMTWATRAPLRVGLETAREGSHHACHGLIPDTTKDVPAHARYWRVAEFLGAGDVEKQTLLPVTDADRHFARERLPKNGRPILAVHVGARWETKRWPTRNYAAVAARFQELHGGMIVSVGGPDEAALSHDFAEELRCRLPHARFADLAGRTTLPQLAAILGRADLLLSGDSGPMHLAAGIGTRCVSLFTCTSPERSGPADPKHRLVAARVPCAASYNKVCPFNGCERHACFDDITVDRALTALLEAYSAQKSEPKPHLPERDRSRTSAAIAAPDA